MCINASFATFRPFSRLPAFNGDFQENSGTMHLVEDDVQAFEHFVRWVYERRIDFSLDIPSEMLSKDDKDDLLMARMRQMFDLYILADKYDVPLPEGRYHGNPF